MSDPNHSLPEILAELREALDSGDEPLDSSLRDELRQTAAEIDEALGASGAGPVSDTLRGRVTAALERFEDSHPRLTGIVGRIADALSDLGI